jgi:CRP-like cAMP-binding protein
MNPFTRWSLFLKWRASIPGVAPVDTDVLRTLPVFSNLDANAIRGLAALAHSRRCNPNDIIVEQDSPCDAVYVIIRGRASVSVAAQDGREVVLRDVGASDFIGEVSLFDGGLRSATVTALTATELVAIDRAPFLAFLERQPKVAIRLLAVLAARLRRLTLQVDDLTGLPVRARLAKCLIGLSGLHGQQLGPSRIRLGVKLPQAALARRLAVTRESVNKHLRHFEREGLLLKENGYLVVVDLPKLHQEALVR